VRFASIGSGSSGNALVVESGPTQVLLDCGFSAREAEARLTRLGVEAARLAAIVVTHEHEDHACGVFGLARRHGIPVCISYGTLASLREADLAVDSGVEVRVVCAEEWLQIEDIAVLPYTVPHDAREPVQFLFSDGARRLGVLTDSGCSTAHIQSVLSGCDGLVLETNHDLAMLMSGAYPYALKSRIASRLGHLDNTASAALLGAIDCSRLKHVVAAHLSQKNNNADLARGALAAALGCAPDWVEVASQARGFGWRELV
jgi:phosphoribosyl 1,2-cyclic phosphodiesterase